MQIEIICGNLAINLDNDVDLQKVRRAMQGADGVDAAFIADLLQWSGVNGLYPVNPMDLGASSDTPVVSDVPMDDEDGAIGVNLWAYLGNVPLAEQLIRQGSARFSRV